jgi:hypothetical protein
MRLRHVVFTLSLGVSICLDVISIETLDHDLGRVGLDGRENLDKFKKLVLMIEKSRSRSRSLDRDQEISILSQNHLPVSKVSIEIEKSVET